MTGVVAVEAEAWMRDLFEVVHSQGHSFSGIASELLTRLGGSGEGRQRKLAIPQSPQALANALRRLQPALSQAGLNVEFKATANARLIRLTLDSHKCPVCAESRDKAGQADDEHDDDDD
jgi:hypothetical protein